MYLKFGEFIYIQAMSEEFKWLSGGRGKGNDDSFTRHKYKNNDETKKDKHYRFKIQANDRVNPGKMDGQCVKYGDWVYLWVTGDKEGHKRWLSGCRGDKQEGTKTNDVQGNSDGEKLPNHYAWQFRSNMGNGDVGAPDPAKGNCIMDQSAVFIQNGAMKMKWLSNWEKEEAKTRNYIQKSAQPTDKRFKWILRRLAGDGSTVTMTNAVACQPKAAKGAWVHKHTSNGEQTVTYTTGITKEESKDYTKSENWEVGVTVTVEADMVFGSTSVESSFSYGQEVSQSVGSSLSFEESEEYSTTFPPGVVWQYQTIVTDVCGADTAMKAKHLYSTERRDEPPCCVPGYFQYLEHAHGPCKGDSPCSCEEDVCSGKALEEKLKNEFLAEEEQYQKEDEWLEEMEEEQREKELEEYKDKQEEDSYEEDSYEADSYEEEESSDSDEGSSGGGKKKKKKKKKKDSKEDSEDKNDKKNKKKSDVVYCSEDEMLEMLEDTILDGLYPSRRLGDINIQITAIANTGSDGGDYGDLFGDSRSKKDKKKKRGKDKGGRGGSRDDWGRGGGRGGGGGGGRGGGGRGSSGCIIDDELFEYAEASILEAVNDY
ncbi:expressed unknown protein [Seminavis robusta]|uniref:Uncharacterized protein n=1 Tax=Seminavis robusta TaxID=568900 RepID=A0A9N8E430_9STRA|nr:expressed unknown protein [Seminavis robusta]|eukprot:Sro530_g161240.1 n/a (596) ;mRNA; f:37607-39570